MTNRILTFAAALAVFAAGWLARDAVRPLTEADAAPMLASFAPLGADEEPSGPGRKGRPVVKSSVPKGASDAVIAEALASDAVIAEAVIPAGRPLWSDRPASAPDSIGVLLERRLGADLTGSVVDDYLLYLPPGVERGGRWPVILYLHGRSLRGNDLSMVARYGLPRYLKDGRSLPFIVVAPQLPDGQSWTDVDRLAELLDDVLDRYPADRDRVYLTGYSMGGGGVWRMIREYGDLFAAVAPMAAHTPAPGSEWPRVLSRLPIRVFHGTADEAAPFAPAEAMVRYLRSEGLEVEFDAVQGANHGALTRLYRDDDLYDWFLSHRRAGR